MRATIPIHQGQSLPRWQRPESLLLLMALASPLAFATWMALLNNFVVERAGFNGLDIGVLHVVREIPGFLAFLVIYILLVLREQTLALAALVVLGVGTAATGFLPSYWGLLLTTVVSSIGFHYYETVNQSMQLQWIDKQRAPRVLAQLQTAASIASLAAFGGIILATRAGILPYEALYLAGGGACALIGLIAWAAYPRFEGPHPQGKRLVLRSRYWLFYVLTFLAGARRQIFVVFAPFMMVERFGLHVHELTGLMLVNFLGVIVFSPIAGRLVQRFGERSALVIEHGGLVAVFLSYAAIYLFDLGVWVAMALYVLDHLLFTMSLAQKTYFQKIADPRDQAPTAAVSFTINHIAAVTLPAPLGLLWLVAPESVYLLAASFAFVSLVLSFLVPRHPAPGNETVLRGPLPLVQPGE